MTCVGCSDGCAVCEEKETCTKCQRGYQKTDVGLCQKCPDNCLNCG